MPARSRLLCMAAAAMAWACGALAQQASVAPVPGAPAHAIAANWAADGTVSSSTSGAGSPDDYFWVGQIYGRIDPTGKVEFFAKNGCHFIGVVSPGPAPYMPFTGTAQMTLCPKAEFNRRFGVSVKTSGQYLGMSLTLVDQKGGTSVTYRLDGTFAKY